MSASVRRVFKTKWFHKAAGKAGIADGELCRAVRELARGQGVDPGGNVGKRRLGKLAADVGRHTDSDIATLVALKELVEICNG